jgi:hypothetical protein
MHLAIYDLFWSAYIQSEVLDFVIVHGQRDKTLLGVRNPLCIWAIE